MTNEQSTVMKYLTDRRIIWAIWLIVMFYVFASPIGFPVEIGPYAHKAYDFVVAQPAGSMVLASVINLGAFLDGNHYPPQIALQNLVWSQDVKVVYFGTDVAHKDALEFFIRNGQLDIKGAVYGTDYVLLGPILGGEAAERAFYEDIWTACGGEDWYGTPLSQIPIMANVQTAANFDYAVMHSSAPSWLEIQLRQLVQTYGTPLISTGPGAMAGEQRPYVDSDQLVSALAGAAGGAELEALSGIPRQGTGSNDAFASAVIVFIIFVIIGNVAEQMQKTKSHGGIK